MPQHPVRDRAPGPTRRMALAAAAALAAPGLARAQEDWPARPVRLVVPFAPGGNTDISARLLATHLAPRLGRPVVIENKAGATTTIGAAEVARAAPDGYTFLVAPPPFVLVQFAFANLPYNPVADFRPVGMILTSPFVLAVRADLPARSVAELVALAKARPGALTYASSGNGSLPHIATELFRLRTGTDILHVPYRGGGPSVIDLAGGRVDMALLAPAEVKAQVDAGRIRLLAVSTPEPTPLVPGLPTIAATVPGFSVVYWVGIMAPAGVPAPIVARLNTEIQAVLRLPEMVQRLTELGGTGMPGGVDAFEALLARERAQWSEAVAASGVRVQ